MEDFCCCCSKAIREIANTTCRNQGLFVLLSISIRVYPRLPGRGDVILRRCTHWPVRRLEGTRPRIIDSGAALKCWLSTTCPMAPHTVGSVCGGGGFWHGEESFKGALSVMRLQYHHTSEFKAPSPEMLLEKKRGELWTAFIRASALH